MRLMSFMSGTRINGLRFTGTLFVSCLDSFRPEIFWEDCVGVRSTILSLAVGPDGAIWIG